MADSQADIILLSKGPAATEVAHVLLLTSSQSPQTCDLLQCVTNKQYEYILVGYKSVLRSEDYV
jgi:hypothetical protein